MNLYLVQHADAHPKDLDPDRSLTATGLGDVVKMATFLRRLRLPAPQIWNSSKKRAMQTAQLLEDGFAGARPQTHEGLAPDDPVAPIRQEIESADRDVMIVGHMPFLSKLASLLLAGNEEAGSVAFAKGGVLLLTRSETGGWAVGWMITPALIHA